MVETKNKIFIVARQKLFPSIIKAVSAAQRESDDFNQLSFLNLVPKEIDLIIRRFNKDKEKLKMKKVIWLFDANLPNLTELIKQIRKNLPKELNDIVILVTAADVRRQHATIILLNQSLQWGSLGVNKIITYPVKLEKIINF